MLRCCFNRYGAVLGGLSFATALFDRWVLLMRYFCSDACAVRRLPALVGVSVARPPHRLLAGWSGLDWVQSCCRFLMRRPSAGYGTIRLLRMTLLWLFQMTSVRLE
jgi:hypothetical protein